MKHIGNLEITKDNEKDFKDLAEVTGYLYIHSQASLTADALTTVGGNLYIHSQASLPALTTVGGYLYIHSQASLTADALTTVGGYLDIHSQASLPALTTVGGYLYIHSQGKLNAPLAQHNRSDEARSLVMSAFERQGYLLADGILQKIISKKKAGSLTVYKTKHIVKDDVTFVVFDGANYSHGKTLAAAKADLKYKLSSRDTSEFKKWKITDKKPVEDLIRAYRAITGACFEGTKMFCESQELKAKYSVKEIFDLTKGQYGSEQFAGFFSK